MDSPQEASHFSDVRISHRYYFTDSSANSEEEDTDELYHSSSENDGEIKYAAENGPSSSLFRRQPKPVPEVKETGNGRQINSSSSSGRGRQMSEKSQQTTAQDNNGGDDGDGNEDNNENENEQGSGGGRRGGFADSHPGYVILLVFLAYLLILYVVYRMFPDIEQADRKYIKVPRNMDEAKSLAIVLDKHTGHHFWSVLFAFSMVYVFLQTFAIPGSIFLSIMSGFLFSFKTAIFTVCFCSACGATACYMLSWLVGRKWIRRRFPEEIRTWTARVDQERDNLLNFMIFLRITPILPNWFINIAAPLIGVPVHTFWIGSFIGVCPPSMLSIQAGKTLNVMTSPTDHISWGSIIFLALVALLSLLPVLLRNRRSNDA